MISSSCCREAAPVIWAMSCQANPVLASQLCATMPQIRQRRVAQAQLGLGLRMSSRSIVSSC